MYVETQGRASCSGAILDDLHVVTAASCLAYRTGSFFNLPVKVIAGVTDLKRKAHRDSIQVDKAYIPRSYLVVNGVGADIAVLKVSNLRVKEL